MTTDRMRSSPQIKVCGLTRPDEAAACAELGLHGNQAHADRCGEVTQAEESLGADEPIRHTGADHRRDKRGHRGHRQDGPRLRAGKPQHLLEI